MNSTQALSRLRKLLGKNAAIRDDKHPSSPEMRAAAQKERIEASERRHACETAMTERREVVLAADAEYQRLRAEFLAAREVQKNAPFPSYRYTGGTVSALFFHVTAQADTLAELVEKAEAKK